MTSAQAARNINLHVFETLYARDENARPVPDLAEGVTISPDGLTYVFTLRRGVKFHNGKEMGAADVVASLERYRKVGASASLIGAIDTIAATGPNQVTIKLKSVQSTFLGNLSSPRAPIAIMPAEEAAKESGKAAPIGTGPFKFVEYKPDSHVKLARFDEYKPNPAYKERDGFAGAKIVYLDTRDLSLHARSGRARCGVADRPDPTQRNERRPDGEAPQGQPQLPGDPAPSVCAAGVQVQPRAWRRAPMSISVAPSPR